MLHSDTLKELLKQSRIFLHEDRTIEFQKELQHNLFGKVFILLVMEEHCSSSRSYVLNDIVSGEDAGALFASSTYLCWSTASRNKSYFRSSLTVAHLISSNGAARLGLISRSIDSFEQGRHQRGTSGARLPHLKSVPPFHVWPPGCCIHPIVYLKNVPPLRFSPPCCEILATCLHLSLGIEVLRSRS